MSMITLTSSHQDPGPEGEMRAFRSRWAGQGGSSHPPHPQRFHMKMNQTPEDPQRRITVTYLQRAWLQSGDRRAHLRTWPGKCREVASGQPLRGTSSLWLNSSFNIYPSSRNWIVFINSSFHVYPSSRNGVVFMFPCDQVPALYMFLPLDSNHHSCHEYLMSTVGEILF